MQNASSMQGKGAAWEAGVEGSKTPEGLGKVEREIGEWGGMEKQDRAFGL